ncbi:MAG: SIS domain-containing protein [Halofilum sp. (in: g-proteobacteria)]|nr:SIS domain-containing protein [Halofilum sp. (in: g-proteobacteria)]
MTHFHLDDQIAAQPAAVRAVLDRAMGATLLDPARPILFAGEGTSLHAARIAAAWSARLTGGAVRAHAIDAHALALGGPLRSLDQVVVVSHRGSKRFPGEVLRRARQAGAATICVTGEGRAEIPADHVIRTCADETSGTHTVSYVSALAALARLLLPLAEGETRAAFGAALESVPEAMAATLALPAPVDAAGRLCGHAPLLIAGTDLDAVTAEEAALKIKEGAYIWAEGMSAEAALHGPVAVYGPAAAAIVIEPAVDDGGRVAALAQVGATVGMEVLHSGPGNTALPFSEVSPWVRPLVSVLPQQRLVAEMARLRGTDPDSIRGHEEPWATAIAGVKL